MYLYIVDTLPASGFQFRNFNVNVCMLYGGRLRICRVLWHRQGAPDRPDTRFRVHVKLRAKPCDVIDPSKHPYGVSNILYPSTEPYA